MEALCFTWSIDDGVSFITISDIELKSLDYDINGSGSDIPVPNGDPYYIANGYTNRTVNVSFRSTIAENVILSDLYTETNIEIIASTESNTAFPELQVGSKWTVSNVDDVAQSGCCGTRDYALTLTHRGDL